MTRYYCPYGQFMKNTFTCAYKKDIDELMRYQELQEALGKNSIKLISSNPICPHDVKRDYSGFPICYIIKEEDYDY